MKVKTLIVGLGNPGQKYEKTRHNAGFMILDNLCPESFKKEKKFEAEIYELDEETVLMKPQTFMNRSGQAVKSFADYYDIETKDIWVVYDDIDIPFGEVKVREGGSSAGHKGIDSLIDNLGSSDFLKFRVGVKNEDLEQMETESFVLQTFNKEEAEILPEIVDLCIDEIRSFLGGGKVEPKTLKVDK